MHKNIGQTFRNEVIDLDFTHWEKCNFLECTIHTNYGIFKLVKCDFVDCNLSLGGSAQTVALLIKGFFPDKPIHFENKK